MPLGRYEMSVDYRGELGSGLLSKVTNNVNGKKYNISTVRQARTGEWETAAFEQTLFGAFRHLICLTSSTDGRARCIHDAVEDIVEQRDPADWATVAETTAASVAAWYRSGCHES